MDTGYWEVYGNPDGKPAAVLHGGPGSGATPWWRQFFDPSRYRVVMFDQRGCGRSTPSARILAALENNTTAHLIADIEALRDVRGIDRWLLFGASWGSTLGLSYPVEHPDRVSELVRWALVTTRPKDVQWLTHVMSEICRKEFDELLSVIPSESRSGNILAAMSALLPSPDAGVRDDEAARVRCAWEDRIATLSGPVIPSPRWQEPAARLGFARLVTRYFSHHAFLDDDAITSRLHRISHIPAYFLRGRLHIASPLRAAYEIAQQLLMATLEIVEADAHGAGGDTVDRLVKVLDEFARSTTP